MKSKKSSLIIAAVITVFSFITISWFSCTRPKQPQSCNGVVCVNGGHCYQDTVPFLTPRCACPAGFEGANCSTPSVNKFIGYWNVRHHVDYSDSVGYAGTDSIYVMQLMRTSTNTSFFMYNLFGNPNYNNIVCNIDSTESDHFTIDTLSNLGMHFANYKIDTDGWGNIHVPDSIVVHMVTRSISPTSNRRRDSITLHMWPH